MKISVVGGSLGGLTAACLLRDSGHDVSVYERSATRLQQRGAGIGLLPPAYRYLQTRAGVDLEDICLRTSRIRYLDRGGDMVYDKAQSYLFSSWNTVYAATLEHFGVNDYHLGSEMTAFRQTMDSVSVSFSDQRSVESDLLVAADGIGSFARSKLLPSSKPEYSGYVALRGVVPESRIPPASMDRLADAITYFVYPNSHILVYPIPDTGRRVTAGDRLINFVWYRNYSIGGEIDSFMTDKNGRRRNFSIPEGFVSADSISVMKEMALRDLPAILSDVVVETVEPFVQAIYDIDIDQMAFGRVCLIGDAAIVARPHAAAGTAKAAADGWALAEALDTHQSVTDALEAWQQSQLRRAKELLDRTRRVGAKSQFLNTWDPADPELVFGLDQPGAPAIPAASESVVPQSINKFS
jgi:2,6-dihydroxypyridine 3-monooxygenase